MQSGVVKSKTPGGVVMDMADAERSLSALMVQGRSGESQNIYRRALRLLSVAKAQGYEKLYLIVKVFACTGLCSRSLPMVTVENVKKGRFWVTYRGARKAFRIPACLQRELLSFAESQGIQTGPIFLTKLGTTPFHTYISHSIVNLCAVAKVPEKKGNPGSLRKLYYSTRAGVESSFERLIEQTMGRQMEQEQLTVGWDV